MFITPVSGPRMRNLTSQTLDLQSGATTISMVLPSTSPGSEHSYPSNTHACHKCSLSTHCQAWGWENNTDEVLLSLVREMDIKETTNQHQRTTTRGGLWGEKNRVTYVRGLVTGAEGEITSLNSAQGKPGKAL